MKEEKCKTFFFFQLFLSNFFCFSTLFQQRNILEGGYFLHLTSVQNCIVSVVCRNCWFFFLQIFVYFWATVLNYFKAEILGTLKVIHKQTRYFCLRGGNVDPYQDEHNGCLWVMKGLVEFNSSPQPVKAPSTSCIHGVWCVWVCKCACMYVCGFWLQTHAHSKPILWTFIIQLSQLCKSYLIPGFIFKMFSL